jgi:hypothetical protein
MAWGASFAGDALHCVAWSASKRLNIIELMGKSEWPQRASPAHSIDVLT